MRRNSGGEAENTVKEPNLMDDDNHAFFVVVKLISHLESLTGGSLLCIETESIQGQACNAAT